MDKYRCFIILYLYSVVHISALYWLNDTLELETTKNIYYSGISYLLALHKTWLKLHFIVWIRIEFEWYNIILLCITNYSSPFQWNMNICIWRVWLMNGHDMEFKNN